LATKLVDADAITIKNKAIIVICKLSNFPIISVGFVKILSISENFWFRKISEPVTINTEKKENIIKKTNCNIHDVIEESFIHLKLLFKNRNATIENDLIANQLNVLGSHEDLVNVIVNILENSIKYSTDLPLINVSTFNEADHIFIKITDNGMGMNNDVKEKIFDKFYRETKGNIHNVKGHGLGLSYVKKIVDLHFGTINVDSILDKGSTFTIKFPLNI